MLFALNFRLGILGVVGLFDKIVVLIVESHDFMEIKEILDFLAVIVVERRASSFVLSYTKYFPKDFSSVVDHIENLYFDGFFLKQQVKDPFSL